MEPIVTVHGILSYAIEENWFLVKDLINSALDYSDYKFTEKSVRDACIRKEMQLWVAESKKNIEACAVTQIVDYPGKKILIIMFAAGKFVENWLPFIHILDKYAYHNGCRSIEIYGRKGWVKKLSPFGYEQIHAVYRKDLRADEHEKDIH